MAFKQLSEDVDCPVELIDAAKKGNLVVFAGAGVSAPSGIPCFTEFFTDLVDKFPLVLPPSGVADGDREAILKYFKLLEDADKPFKEVIVRRIIEGKYSPNDLHTAILCLFPTDMPVKIITTNFDTLFTDESGKLLSDTKPRYAPDLPEGQDFEGIVYLHGSVTSGPSSIVISKLDFANAYMGKTGYGYDFLHNVFANCTVLWVGFSFQDPLFEYMLMPHNDETFTFYAFVPDDRAKRKACRNLGVQPIDYPYGPDEAKHRPLVDAIINLASIVNPKRMSAVVDSRKKPKPEDYSDYARRMARITSHTR